MEKSLLEIYNKYLVTGPIGRDPKFELVKEAIKDIVDSSMINLILKNLYERPDFMGKNLWKPGLNVIRVEDETKEPYVLTLSRLLVQRSDLFRLILSELLDEIYNNDEIKVLRCIYSFMGINSNNGELIDRYVSYINSQEIYIYKLPNLKSFNEKTPKIIKCRLLAKKVDICSINISSTSVLDMDNNFINIDFAHRYGLAFSREMVKEQFKILKKRYMDNLYLSIDYLHREIDLSNMRTKELEKELEKSIDNVLINDSRLDELFNIEEEK